MAFAARDRAPDAHAERILARVRAVPPGSVRTYGDIDPEAPRVVGRVLATTHEGVPWHRVVRADGTAAQGQPQLDLLRREGVPMRDGHIDLHRARLRADPPEGGGPPKAPRASLASAIAILAEADPVIARMVEAVGPIRHRPPDRDGSFGALVRAIVFQQLAGRAANAIHGRVRALVDGSLTPEALLAVPDEALRSAGLSAAKLASLRDLSRKVLDGTVVLSPRSRIPDEEVVARLVTVRGIGRWTAEMYLMFALRRLDVWPVEDLGVRQGYGLAWGLHPPPTAKQLGPLGDWFRPYRSVAARYCWEAVHLARRGADTALR
jgi:DNA-3-methyladenine glycosylase II